MLDLTRVYYIIFGILAAVGGIIGYMKAGSKASIIAGVISGILLCIAAFLLRSHFTYGLAGGMIVSVLLALRFVPAFITKGGFMPAGLMAILSVVAIVVSVLCWYKR